MEEHDQSTFPFEKNRLTSDRGRYERMQALLRAQPFLQISGPTFGWLGAALASIREMRRSDFAEAIRTPLLIFGAGRDRVVRTAAIRDLAERLPDARYIEIAESEHEILMERDEIRAQFWSAFDSFVNEELQKPEPPARGFAAKRAG